MSDQHWYDDRDELIAFGHVLLGVDHWFDAKMMLYYFEKPWKYNPEYELWLGHQKPTPEDENWELFERAFGRVA